VSVHGGEEATDPLSDHRELLGAFSLAAYQTVKQLVAAAVEEIGLSARGGVGGADLQGRGELPGRLAAGYPDLNALWLPFATPELTAAAVASALRGRGGR
jgi:hypothetical protein